MKYSPPSLQLEKARGRGSEDPMQPKINKFNKLKKKTGGKNQIRVCDRNHIWPAKPKIFTIWALYRKDLTTSEGLISCLFSKV